MFKLSLTFFVIKIERVGSIIKATTNVEYVWINETIIILVGIQRIRGCQNDEKMQCNDKLPAKRGPTSGPTNG